ncbi:MAG: methyltransferase protein [Caulobacteraceae bacterium]|nr:methyltransferase protein [Caulobacteraceae bacterium]
MAGWADGYVVDIAYPRFFIRETMPSWLTTVAMLLGQQWPDLSKPFRYANLGCGSGLTDIVVAATWPNAEVWGFDFNPTHIANARRLAERAGLRNVTFVETSFADVARRPQAELPEFEFVVAHGILSWISESNRECIFELIRQRLRTGGLAYLGYNVAAGWSSLQPVRELMQLIGLADKKRSDLAIGGILEAIDGLREAGARYFDLHPTVQERLTYLRQADPRYLAHELLTEDWHPLTFADVARDMSEAKCSFVGSATLTDNIDVVSVPPKVVPLLEAAKDLRLKETLRDIGCAQSFRRDIFCRGPVELSAAEQSGYAESLAIVSIGAPIKEGVTFKTPLGEVVGPAEVYDPLLKLLEQGALSVREAQGVGNPPGRPLVETVQAFIMLVAGGYAAPLPMGGTISASRSACRRLNVAIVEANANGGDIAWLASPVTAAAIPSDWTETQIVRALLSPQTADAENISREVLHTLNRVGRTVQHEGQTVTDPDEALRIVTEAVKETLETRAPILARLGVIDG